MTTSAFRKPTFRKFTLALTAAVMWAASAHAQNGQAVPKDDVDITADALGTHIQTLQGEIQAASDAIDAKSGNAVICDHLHKAYAETDDIMILANTYETQVNAHDDYTAKDKTDLIGIDNQFRDETRKAQGQIGSELAAVCGTKPQTTSATSGPAGMTTGALIDDMVDHSTKSRDATGAAADHFKGGQDTVGCGDLNTSKDELDLAFADLDEYDSRLKSDTSLSAADRADMQKDASSTRDQMQSTYDLLTHKIVEMCPA